MIDIRTEIRDAFEREQSAFPPPPTLRAQVVEEVSGHARASAPARQRAGRDLNWLMGAVAILLAIAIVAGLLAVRLTNSHQTPVKHGPASQLCVVGPTGPSDRFATVHGYIAYSDGSEIWAVPGQPDIARVVTRPDADRLVARWEPPAALGEGGCRGGRHQMGSLRHERRWLADPANQRRSH
jgi:hypothetical protein